MSNVLVLDSTYRPHKIVSWQRAVTLFFSSKVEVVEEYADREIKATSIAIKAPAVVRLLGAVRPTKRDVRFSRINILTRDGFRCQYCGHRRPMRQLNYDHVTPRSRGGRTTWTNVVTCCFPCNQRKGSRLPAEAGMRLMATPVRPASLPLTMLRVDAAQSIPDQWRSYLWYLGGLDEDREDRKDHVARSGS